MQDTYWLFGTRLRILASGSETAGRYDLIEGWFAPGVQTPPHRHSTYSEQLYILEGEFTVWTGKEKTVLRPGDDYLIPAGTPHVVAATGNEPSRGLVVASPSAFARLITEAGTPGEPGNTPPTTPPDMERILRVSGEIGDEVLGPPGSLPEPNQ